MQLNAVSRLQRFMGEEQKEALSLSFQILIIAHSFGISVHVNHHEKN